MCRYETRRKLETLKTRIQFLNAKFIEQLQLSKVLHCTHISFVCTLYINFTVKLGFSFHYSQPFHGVSLFSTFEHHAIASLAKQLAVYHVTDAYPRAVRATKLNKLDITELKSNIFVQLFKDISMEQLWVLILIKLRYFYVRVFLWLIEYFWVT